jgi:hypothetical protein
MGKENLKDVTFLIQTRLDSIDRLVNLRATVEFLQKPEYRYLNLTENTIKIFSISANEQICSKC